VEPVPLDRNCDLCHVPLTQGVGGNLGQCTDSTALCEKCLDRLVTQNVQSPFEETGRDSVSEI